MTNKAREHSGEVSKLSADKPATGYRRHHGHRDAAYRYAGERGGDLHPPRRRRNARAGSGGECGGGRRQAPDGRDAAGGDPASGSDTQEAETTRPRFGG